MLQALLTPKRCFNRAEQELLRSDGLRPRKAAGLDRST